MSQIVFVILLGFQTRSRSLAFDHRFGLQRNARHLHSLRAHEGESQL
jgi:hypothetical protein